jgi:Pectinacetylesterase
MPYRPSLALPRASALLFFTASLVAGCADSGDGLEPYTLTSNAGSGGGAGSSGDQGAGGGAGSAGGQGAGGGAALPKLSELAAGQVNIIKPGGETVCGRGTEYSFFVIPGDPKKVIIEFEGGGACWDELTCAFSDELFKKEVDPAAYTGDFATKGWYDHQRAGHPMPDWTHVYIPYCTGDLHWGDSVKTYGAVTINHKGAVNARAVLDWTYAQIDAPDKVFVTGCSAGGYGSIWWAPDVQQRYPQSKVYQFADSAAGVITNDFFQKSFPSWNAQSTFPTFIGDFAAVTALPLLYQAVANHYPQNVYSQYNTELDGAQAFFYNAMGGPNGPEGWSAGMKANVKATAEGAPNFRAYTAEGEQHCILPFDNFYTVETGGTKLTTWLSDMVNDRPVANASCEGCAPLFRRRATVRTP